MQEQMKERKLGELKTSILYWLLTWREAVAQ